MIDFYNIYKEYYMADIKIRKVRPEDARQYVELVNYVWRDAYNHIFPEDVFVRRENKTEEKIENFDKKWYNDDTQVVYVAEDNGKIVGVMCGRLISAYSHFADKNFADLEQLYILPNYQGQGIANKLKNIFIDWAQNHNAKKYVIGVLKDNLKARKVYEKWGGKLSEYTSPFKVAGFESDEVFYTYEIEPEKTK